MEMGISWIILVTAPFHLVSTTALSSEELYVVENTTTNELTCISQDDDAALVWNYDLRTNESSDRFNNFKPVKLINNKITRCAVWRSEQCLARWKSLGDWRTVNSLVKPMGPVVDYRWEGFKEAVSSKSRLYFEPVSCSTGGTVVFSVRGTEDIQVYMCDSELYSCFVVTITVEGRYFALQNCYEYSKSDGQRNRICREIAERRYETAAVDAHEWRTFRFKWISNAQVIKIFNDNESNAFLIGNVTQWHNVCNIEIQSATSARLKLHAYNYTRTKSPFQILSTQQFPWNETNFCINMLLSLCPLCRINVSLVDSRSSVVLAYESISGDNTFGSDNIKIWQSIKLNMSLGSLSRSEIKLRITSLVDGLDYNNVWWAIDNLRVCEKDHFRASTIQLASLDRNRVDRNIKCQKLFHGKVVSVDLSTSKPYANIKPQYEIHRAVITAGKIDVVKWDRSSSSTDYIKIWFVTIPIVVIFCLLLWCWRYKKSQVQRSLSQDLPLDPVVVIPDNSTKQTSHVQNVSLASVYSIPSYWSCQTKHTPNVLSARPCVNMSNNPEDQMSYSQDVSLDLVYTNTRVDLRNQTSQSQDFPMDALYTKLDNLEMRTSYSQDVSSEPIYAVPDDSTERTSYARDVSLDPVYATIPDDSTVGINYLEDNSLDQLYVNTNPNNLRK